jgi:cytochrome c-type biogenesis protein CcmH
MKQFKSLWFLLFLLSVLTFTGVASAQDPDEGVTDDEVNRVARELYCPICENTPLDVCETRACEDWRQLIREKLEAGQSEEQIVEYFASVYGERARATPATRGLSLVVWIAPVVGAAVGLAFFARLLRRWLARGAEAERATVPAPTIPLKGLDAGETDVDDYVARLEQEIQETA